MEPSNDKALSAADRLDKLGCQLDVLEHRIKADLSLTSDWYARHFTEVRAEIRMTHQDIKSLQPPDHQETKTRDDDSDHHWCAVKSAVQTYRNHVGLGSGQT